MNKRESGFSFLELIVVVAIMGIVFAISLPSLNSVMRKTRVNSSVNNLVTNLLWAKMRAVSENNNYVIKFDDPSANKYSIYDDGDSNWSTSADNTLVKTVSLAKGILFGRAASGVKRTSCGASDTIDADGLHVDTGNKIVFTPKGTPKAIGASVYLLPEVDDENHESDTERWRAMSVSAAGRVKSFVYSGGSCPWQ